VNAPVAAVLVTLVCGACAGTATRPPARDFDVVTREELLATREQDAYEAVKRIRPHWLQARAPNEIRREGPTEGNFVPRAADQVQLYLDATRLGDVTALRQIQVRAVLDIRFLNGNDATTRYGIGHTAGALIITTIRE
jgi:hypothetical protein